MAGANLLYSNDADKLLFRARLAASFFAFSLALLVFFAGSEIAGFKAGLRALVLLIFEPNIVGHGSLADTDVGASCCIFASVYSLYRYMKRPSLGRLAVSGVAAGFALGAKFSGVLIEPIFLVLIALELLRKPEDGNGTRTSAAWQWRRSAGALSRWAGTFALINLAAILILWSMYGFRYPARSKGLNLNPTFPDYVNTVPSPPTKALIFTLARWHVLPESYLYGLAAISNDTQGGRKVFVLGKYYETGQWFYFPVVFLIKSTIGLIGLLLLAALSWSVWNRWHWREISFAVVPPLIYFGFCVFSKLDLGIRHLLPIFPFLFLIAGGGAAALINRSWRWAVPAFALLVLHGGSSLNAYPAYLAYSNEAWGGTNQTFKWLGDSNVGWSAGLKEVARYVRDQHVSPCWISAGEHGRSTVLQHSLSPPSLGRLPVLGRSASCSATRDRWNNFRR